MFRGDDSMKYEAIKEIMGQSKELKLTIDMVISRSEEIRSFFTQPGDIVFIGCGSSYWLSLSAHRTFQLLTGRRTYAIKAGEILMNPEEHRDVYENPILVCPSRSGSTTEQLKAIKILRDYYGKVPIISAVEYLDSPLEKISNLCLLLPWANEVSVCQTRSFCCLYLTTILIAALVSKENSFLKGLEGYIEIAQSLHSKAEQQIKDIVSNFTSFDQLIAIGSGRQYGVVIEGAYIGIEMALLNASYYSVLELRHGPIVTVDENTLVALASNGSSREYEEGIAKEVRDQGGKVLAVVGNGGFTNADWVIDMGGDYPAEAIALYFVFLMQLFAYYQAIRLDLDPDHPGDLVPYITL